MPLSLHRVRTSACGLVSGDGDEVGDSSDHGGKRRQNAHHVPGASTHYLMILWSA